MEFHEKLQALRKRRGITQEELASALYVSRTAVSKWESGRGFPNIDSLKAIAVYYGVTVDTLLSGEELLVAVQEEQTRAVRSIRDRIFGLLDVGMLLLLLLPLFGQETEGGVRAVSLLMLTGVQPYVSAAALVLVGLSVLWGIAVLALQSCTSAVWVKVKAPVSVSLGLSFVLFFILTRHPYAALLALSFMAVKAVFLLKRV